MELETEDFDDNFDEDEFENSKLENSKGKKNKKKASFEDDEEDFDDDFAAEFDEPSPSKKAKKSRKSGGKRDPNDLMSLLASADEFSALVSTFSVTEFRLPTYGYRVWFFPYSVYI